MFKFTVELTPEILADEEVSRTLKAFSLAVAKAKKKDKPASSESDISGIMSGLSESSDIGRRKIASDILSLLPEIVSMARGIPGSEDDDMYHDPESLESEKMMEYLKSRGADL